MERDIAAEAGNTRRKLPYTSCSYVDLERRLTCGVCNITDDVEIGARPRRMSEVKSTSKKLPIPPASSFFIFSPTNRWTTVEIGDVGLADVCSAYSRLIPETLCRWPLPQNHFCVDTSQVLSTFFRLPALFQ